jgi:predicted ABC-type ATPase
MRTSSRRDCRPFLQNPWRFVPAGLMLAEIEILVGQETDFGFETMLSGRSYLNLVRHLKERAYQVHFFYLWIPRADLALSRVRQRVLRGGHDVPEVIVRRRFDRSIRNFLIYFYGLADSWNLYDNTFAIPRIIASKEQGQLRIVETKLYNDLVRRYGRT